jgi:hypothetical protein
MTATQIDHTEFAAKFQTWVDGCNAIREAYFSKHYPSLHARTRYALEQEHGKRYIRIVDTEYNRETGEKHSGSVYAFIDATNGDVLKAASYKTPAKQSRGNIFDEHNGLKAMGPHGTAYLR